jgi:hypothetical protein
VPCIFEVAPPFGRAHSINVRISMQHIPSTHTLTMRRRHLTVATAGLALALGPAAADAFARGGVLHRPTALHLRSAPHLTSLSLRLTLDTEGDATTGLGTEKNIRGKVSPFNRNGQALRSDKRGESGRVDKSASKGAGGQQSRQRQENWGLSWDDGLEGLFGLRDLLNFTAIVFGIVLGYAFGQVGICNV